MSKVDAQRAMREAKYAARNAAGTPGREGAAAARATPAAPEKRESAPAAATPAGGASETAELCGHKSMNGRTCTRPAGHSEKNHRYG